MRIQQFSDLLQAARQQPTPQRLLFVFVGVELPEHASPAQAERFAAGEGGVLVPLMCVDRMPEELTSFEALAQEATLTMTEMAQQAQAQQLPVPTQDWRMVFVAALSGDQQAPSRDDAVEPLQRMVESIRQGQLDRFIPFDRDGGVLSFG